jgi:hypothetical protein
MRPVPEPATYALLFLGLIALLVKSARSGLVESLSRELASAKLQKACPWLKLRESSKAVNAKVWVA